ncbi:23S rRNA (adenine(1618)-N(6))-methyltransferase RlmF [Thalassotalea atypica]|uniref:23S rRNA (adenine(1618)-N(6))-methyltransferase RlmF n=1 Tax=Thalassotalea atypica TaxID=2054316 RepID=UPI002573D312|nr:23S rRNA (adenine(1618)-N(6))-methyltransferase RlmF [Thalassotalea atypica]
MTVKHQLHPRNQHKRGYDFKALCKTLPSLKPYVYLNKYQSKTIDFSDLQAVRTLNQALLAHFYQIDNWHIPQENLCPPIPGRVDYVHYIADLLNSLNDSKNVRVLDIGTGASCIYPLLGYRSYGWSFVATDIDPKSISNAQSILTKNKIAENQIECRLQSAPSKIFDGIVKPDETFDLTMCNPPFHQSLAKAMQGNSQKWANLNKAKGNISTGKETKAALNFGGQEAELWCQGGERTFVRNMIKESRKYGHQVTWFTCLISQKDNVSPLKLALKKQNVTQSKVVKMAQGQKVSRFIAWSFQA